MNAIYNYTRKERNLAWLVARRIHGDTWPVTPQERREIRRTFVQALVAYFGVRASAPRTIGLHHIGGAQ